MKLRTGKIGRTVLDRSVYKRIESPLRGEDGIPADPEGRVAVTADPVTLGGSRAGELSVYAAIGDLASLGARPTRFMPVILLPEDSEESLLREIMDQIQGVCRTEGIRVCGGHTEVTRAVSQPLVIGTGIGTVFAPRRPDLFGPGDSVLMTKWAGLEGTYILSMDKEKVLKDRFPVAMVERTRKYYEWLSVTRDAAAAAMSGDCLMHDCSDGGIFAALWSLADITGTGLSIDLARIPLRQETIEYCEYLGLHPYRMASGGSLLVVTSHPEAALACLREAGIPAVRIGQLTEGKARVLVNGDETSCLDLPGPDALTGVL